VRETSQHDDSWLSTGQAADALGFSRTYLVKLCDQGVLPYERVRTQRRLRRRDVERFKGRSQHMTRDQLRSLWLGYAVAGQLVEDPSGVLSKAHENLARLRQVHKRGQAARWLNEWAKLLDGPIEDVLDVLTSRSQRARELRQNTPFAGVLPESERQQVLRQFRKRASGSLTLV
jgi:excisionase family DNA binding protein